MSERGTLRGEAHFRANNAHGDYLAVVLDAANIERGLPPAWHHLDFRNRHILDVWFRDASLSPDRFVYIAAFDKTTPDWAAEAPVAEMRGAGATGDQPPIGQDAPADRAALRHEASQLARTRGYTWIGVVLQKPTLGDPHAKPYWRALSFSTKEEMLDWFATEYGNLGTTYEYLAIFDKADPRWWSEGAPIAEHRAGGRVVRASGWANGRGEYGNRSISRVVRVTGVADQLKLKRLTTDYNETYAALVEQSKRQSEWSSWFAGVEPIFKGWFAFRKGISDSIDPVSYRMWSDQLNIIRAGAQSRGMKTPVGIKTIAVVGGLALIGAVAIVAATSSRGSRA